MKAVSVSGYYAWKERRPSLHQCYDVVLSANIRAQFASSNQTYGAPRMHAELREEGLSVGLHRVARLMRENGLKAHQKHWFKRTTDSHQDCPIAFDILDQHFACGGPDQKWGADNSYIWTAEGWLYLAILVRQPPAGLIHHSDRGSQYCSDDYRRLLQSNGLIASMSGRGNCYDNAMVETAFKTIKTELIWRASYETRSQATLALGHYIDGFYNPRRRHSALGYKSPITFEAQTAEMN